MKSKIIKVLSCFILCTCFAGVFSGCSGTRKEESKKINIILDSTEDEGNEIKKIAQKWSEDNGIEVNVVVSSLYTGGSADEYLGATQNGSAPQNENSIDIEFGLSHEFLEKLAKLGLAEEVPNNLIDFNNYISKDLIDAVSINNKVYAYPISQECPALFYNKALVNKVPDTMENLVEEGKTKGFEFDLNNFYLSYEFINAEGGYTFKNNNGTFNKDDMGLNSKGAIEGYKFLQDLIQKDKLMPTDINENTAQSAFYNGQSAYYIGETKILKMMKENNANLKFGVVPIPKLDGKIVKPFKGVKVALVNPKSNNKEESYKLLKYIIENSKGILMSKGNRLPVFKDALESESFKNDEYLQGFYLQAKDSEIMPNIVETEYMWGPVTSNLSLLTAGQITPEQCGENIITGIKEGSQMVK
ncbi:MULTISPECIES: extracellular solute-binding protein [unclassified Clostridium]|uniref:extracellular solute-binding protein n=1 Tax=unclassified Clostridium TaxID=2614128 RepID=UPI0002982F4A|nr:MULTISPECIES: extracellular solute-binding protein [unclassified Clostridium]EKQ57004.1 MAG: maltose-binding periplasmic protein [Clostridium sp. Maddingley MBC34-26]